MLGVWNILKNVQSHCIILHQHVSVTPVIIIWVAYNKNTVNIQISVQNYVIQPLGVHLIYKSIITSYIFEQFFVY